MDNISQNSFQLANIIEKPEKLFIHLWCELFNPDTIDSYRVRVMNAPAIITELEEVIDDCVKEITPHLTNVTFVAKEAERVLSRDFICQKHFKKETDFTINFIKSLWDKPKKDELVQLFSKIKLLKEKLDSNYFDLLLTELEDAIFVSKNFINVQLITKSLATQLIQKGYSFNYLYNRKSFFLDNTRGLSFKEKFNFFISDIRKPNREFRVIFKFSSVSSILNYKEIFSIKISDNFIPVSTTDEEMKFDQQPGEIYGEIIVTAPDPYSAVYSTLKSISLLQNIVRYEYRSNEFKISPQFLVYDDVNNNVYLNLTIQRPLGFVSVGKDYRFQKLLENFDALRDDQLSKIDEDSVGRIINSFHYYRLSLDAAEPETRFLLNWVAFEYLIKINMNKGLIEKVVSYIPKLFVTQYLNKLLRDFASNIFRLRCDRKMLSSIGIKTNSTNKFDLSIIFEALRDSSKTPIIISSNNAPLFEVRVNELVELLKDAKSIESKLKEHLDDVQWNLQRIYRVRNKIVHSASTNLNLTQLDGNLSYYYTTLLNNVIYNSINTTTETSLDSIYLRFESLYEYLMSQIKNNNINIELITEY